MRIYFAGSIRGGREDALLYQQLIRFLGKFGHVFTGHIGDTTLTDIGDEGVTDEFIHDRDMEWLLAADFIVAEVTTTSAGVGYEIGRAVALGKKVICLYRPRSGKKLSAMIAGCASVLLIHYQQPEEIESKLSEILSGDFS